MKRKTIGRVIAILVILMIVITGCTAPTASIASIELEKESVLIEKGSTEKLSYTVSPSGIDVGTLIWTSSDESVATVDNGEIHAISEGTATITVETSNGKKDQCLVSVRNTKMRAALMEDAEGIKVVGGHTSILYAGQPEVPNDCLFAYASKDVQDKASENLIKMMIFMMDFTFKSLEESSYSCDGDTFKIVCNVNMKKPAPEYTPLNPVFLESKGTVNITQRADGNWVLDGVESYGSSFIWNLNGVFPYEYFYREIKLPENAKVITSGENHENENYLYMVEYRMTNPEFIEYKKLLGDEIVFDETPDGILVSWVVKGDKRYQWQKLTDDTMAVIIMPL